MSARRSHTWLAARSGADAARDFQKILDRPGAGVYRSPPILVSLSQLGFARAQALAGDSAAARRAYQDFLASWKEADADLAVLREARQEYEKLGPG